MLIKVFDYIAELDCFKISEEFKAICDELELTEWHAAVWVGRFFARDQDFGEHFLDNWPEREGIATKAKEIGYAIDEFEAMVVVPERYAEEHPRCIYCHEEYKRLPCPKCGKEVYVNADGPCHTDKQRKLFWTDVFKTLALDESTIRAMVAKAP